MPIQVQKAFTTSERQESPHIILYLKH
jgi:hypothetical protein